MHIGLISDTHNEQQRIKKALEHFRWANITTVLHAGDISSVNTLRLFADFDMWGAVGNMDRDPQLRPTATALFGPGRLARVQRLTLHEVTIAMLHGDSWTTLESLVRSKNYTYIIHGHTHIPHDEMIGTTRIINPGAVGHPRGYHAPTCATLDLATGELVWIEL